MVKNGKTRAINLGQENSDWNNLPGSGWLFATDFTCRRATLRD